jgi:hypothetical protein
MLQRPPHIDNAVLGSPFCFEVQDVIFSFLELGEGESDYSWYSTWYWTRLFGKEPSLSPDPFVYQQQKVKKV